MSEDPNKGTETGAGKPEKRKIDIDVTVDNKQIKDLLKQLGEQDKKSEKLQADLKLALEAKTTAETSLEEEKTLKEDAESKLKLIAEERLNAKRTIIMDKAKELITDEARLKKIQEGMKKAEDVKATEFMIETLASSLEEGERQHKELLAKEKLDTTRKTLLEKYPKSKDKIEGAENLEALEKLGTELGEGAGAGAGAGTGEGTGTGDEGAAGQARLNEAQTGGGPTTGYDSHQAMVYDLRKRSHSDNPEEAAEASAILDELFRKWSVAVKKQYEGKIPPIDITSEGQPKIADIVKSGGAARPTKPFKKEGEGD